MKKSIICVLFIILGIFINYTVQAQEFFVKGQMKENGKTLKINDSIAIWVAKEKRLHIYFYPFQLTHDEREKAAQGTAGLIPFDKSSPDELQWQWCPFGVLSIGFQDPEKSKKYDDIICSPNELCIHECVFSHSICRLRR